MNKLLLLCLLIVSFKSYAQPPKDGVYTYKIAFSEWGGKTQGATCSVIIKGNHIKVVHNGKSTLSGTKGEIIAEGTIMKQRKTGKWIIGRTAKDKDAIEIGGCSDGP